MIGTPVPSGGQFPVSVVFNQASDMLCAANGGAIDGVRFVHLITSFELVALT